jgi:hypothetical protein
MNCSCVSYVSRGIPTVPPKFTISEALRFSSHIKSEGVKYIVEYEQFVFNPTPKIERVKMNTSLVCTTPSQFYLEVEPKMIWLTPDNGFEEQVAVTSNVQWTIE